MYCYLLAGPAAASRRSCGRPAGRPPPPPRLWFNAPRMFQPVPVFVGLRYSLAREQRFFVSFITWVSLVGVALGVLALITVISVMNGFESELRGRLLDRKSVV